MNAATSPELHEAFDERVERLLRELARAVRFDRPSILLAVYRSEYVLNDAARQLTQHLREVEQSIAIIVVSEDEADIPARIRQRADRSNTVFFVHNLGGGGEAALRALNIRREYFMDDRVRAVFWLTEQEAISLPKHAPDFWAFRHRVVEFVEPPEPAQIAQTARTFAWAGFDDRMLRVDTDAKIALREALLQDLPKGEETLGARGELLYTLATLYWAKDDYERSLSLWQDALTAATELDDPRLQAWCHNGLGNLYLALKQFDDAIAAFQKAIVLDPEDATPHNSLGSVYGQSQTVRRRPRRFPEGPRNRGGP